MHDIIQLLPDAVANRIAAGEVVQRPASVVKELMENSIDAGATSIQLIVKNAGRDLIQVIDDGKGMSEMDARMCFERHATSKIKSSNDIFSIQTMGFRGEALASIAAVAQVELKTKQKEEEVGTFLRIEGSKIKKQESVACQKGSNFAIKNLFFNVPARRSFLKSNPVEQRHIMSAFRCIALAYPEINFSFHQDNKQIYNLEASKLSQRIVAMFGSSYKEQLIACSETTPYISVKGYIGNPKSAKKERKEQYLFVNKRFVKSNYLSTAVFHAYRELIPHDKYPFYVLFIEMEAKHIDVNIHPTKTEIKFENEQLIFNFLSVIVKKALATNNITPSIDFAVDVNFSDTIKNIQTKDIERSGKVSSIKSHTRPSSSRAKWTDFLATSANNESFGAMAKKEQESTQTNYSSEPDQLTIDTPKTENTPQELIFQLDEKYIVSKMELGLLFIHQKTAHERILYEKYKRNLKEEKNTGQQLLFPESIELSHDVYALVKEMEEELSAFGFWIEDFGNNAIILRAVPAEISSNEKEVFLDFLSECQKGYSKFGEDKKHKTAKILAKKAAFKDKKSLTNDEMKSLMEMLFSCENPNYGLDGARTHYILKTDNLKELLLR